MLDELFIPNPEIMNYQKKYIWWNGVESCKVFYRFLERNIYIDGFVHDKKTSLSLFNKTINSLDFVSELGGTCVISDGEKPELQGLGCLLMPFILNPKVQNKKVLIYGCGKNGMSAFSHLQNYPVMITGFIDSDPAKWGNRISGREVYPPDYIKNTDQDTVIVLAAVQTSGMLETVRSFSADIPCVCQKYDIDNSVGVNIEEKVDSIIDGSALRLMCRALSGKAIYLYGISQRLNAFLNFFRCLDIPVKGVLVDTENELEFLPANLDNKLTEEILYENNCYVLIIADQKEKAIVRLQDLGLEVLRDFEVVSYFRNDLFFYRKTILDANIGYTYVSRDGHHGLSILRANQIEKYKIVVLGGSTTDGELYPFPSWTEFLWKKIGTAFISIYNYGVAGYNSGQELVRLMRDIVSCKPDLVLSFDGFNDFCPHNMGINNVFGFGYLDIIMQFSAKHLSDSFMNERKVYRGEEIFQDDFTRWLTNLKFMYSICNSYGIPYMGFLQPMLCDKRNRTEEENLIIEMNSYLFERKKSFRDSLSELEVHYDYIYDLSDIFDNADNVFFDYCHVNEKGNEIIADYILHKITPVLPEWAR